MRTIEQILDIVCEFLNNINIDYVIVGGFAVLFYGNPRTTMDIDYVIQLEDENIPLLIKFLKENGFHADEYDMCAALKEKSHCTVEDTETMFRLDIKGVYSEMVFAREQDIKDALGILVRQYDTLDMDYLEKTTKSIGVNDALKDLMKKYERQK
jgi:hypothetical protein